jgi:hypothetical protein
MKTNLHSIRKSIHANSAQANNCFPASGKKAIKKKWAEEKDLYLGDISGTERVLVASCFATDIERKKIMMDAVTGTLYRIKDGKCYSSDQLHMNSHKKVDGLVERLLQIKGDHSSESE